MLETRIALPKKAIAGEVIQVKTLISHPMHSGFSYDNRGQQIARDILTDFYCNYDGKTVFSAQFNPSVAANPYLSFYIRAKASGPVSFIWLDQFGVKTEVTEELLVETHG